MINTRAPDGANKYKKWNNYQNLIARFDVEGDVLAKTSKLTTTLTILPTN